MTTVAHSVPAEAHAYLSRTCTSGTIRIALLGVGQVGGAVAALVADPRLDGRFTVGKGLVRDLWRERPHASGLSLTCNADEALDGNPDVVLEALGGLEPARTLVLEALDRGIPVVSANKSLLAAHGAELLDRAAGACVPLRYEAAVLAGVPFLGTFTRRWLARDVSGLCGIVNGTTNFILSKMSDEEREFASALADAQQRGYAEPDPANDVNGVDAVEKLCVLLQHFGDWCVRTQDVETAGIGHIEHDDIQAAARLNGRIRPVISADWSTGPLTAFCGPAFVPMQHPLASIDGVQNAVILRNRRLGNLLFAGPGAGPEVTAATLLDDASEALTGGAVESTREWKRTAPEPPATGWFVRLTTERVSDEAVLARLLESHDVYVKRTVTGESRAQTTRWLLTHPCNRARIRAALGTLRSIANGEISVLRTIEC